MQEPEYQSQALESPKTCTHLSREERETYYHIDEVSNEWFADASISKDINRLKRCGWIKVSEQLYSDGTVQSMQFKAPRNCLSPRAYNPNKPKRVMSDEQKAKIQAALSKARENKANSNQQML